MMNSEFVSGARKGKEPQYAPEYQLKYGVDYKYHNRGKVALTSTMLADHFVNDTNSNIAGQNQIPAYVVWDLTGEWKVYKDYVSVLAGVNNLFDENYFSRVRGAGIEPALRRNYYLGFSIEY